MSVVARKFVPKEGCDNLSITVNLRGEPQPVELDSWPVETKDPALCDFLASHPCVAEEEAPIKATAAAERKAEEKGVALENVEPSGANDTVTVDDVEKAAGSDS